MEYVFSRFCCDLCDKTGQHSSLLRVTIYTKTIAYSAEAKTKLNWEQLLVYICTGTHSLLAQFIRSLSFWLSGALCVFLIRCGTASVALRAFCCCYSVAVLIRSWMGPALTFVCCVPCTIGSSAERKTNGQT